MSHSLLKALPQTEMAPEEAKHATFGSSKLTILISPEYEFLCQDSRNTSTNLAKTRTHAIFSSDSRQSRIQNLPWFTLARG
jgi:hypothetical protein